MGEVEFIGGPPINKPIIDLTSTKKRGHHRLSTTVIVDWNS